MVGKNGPRNKAERRPGRSKHRASAIQQNNPRAMKMRPEKAKGGGIVSRRPFICVLPPHRYRFRNSLKARMQA
jgi:hypothetical protein